MTINYSALINRVNEELDRDYANAQRVVDMCNSPKLYSNGFDLLDELISSIAVRTAIPREVIESNLQPTLSSIYNYRLELDFLLPDNFIEYDAMIEFSDEFSIDSNGMATLFFQATNPENTHRVEIRTKSKIPPDVMYLLSSMDILQVKTPDPVNSYYTVVCHSW